MTIQFKQILKDGLIQQLGKHGNAFVKNESQAFTWLPLDQGHPSPFSLCLQICSYYILDDRIRLDKVLL